MVGAPVAGLLVALATGGGGSREPPSPERSGALRTFQRKCRASSGTVRVTVSRTHGVRVGMSHSLYWTAEMLENYERPQVRGTAVRTIGSIIPRPATACCGLAGVGSCQLDT